MATSAGVIDGKLGYRPELDGVRAIAVLLVLWHHLGLLDVPRIGAGFLGVDVFFVLSGFLITTLLLEERSVTGRISLGAFYARRALRLFPALALMLVIAGVFVYVAGIDRDIARYRQSLPWVIFYVGNWKPIGALGILTHTWTLAIEEQFYLLWPPLLLLALRRHIDRRILIGGLGVSVLLLAIVAARWGAVPARSISATGDVVVETYTRAMGILLGCAIAFLPELRRYVREPIVGAVAAVGAIAVFVVRRDPSTFHYRVGFIAFVLFVAIVIAHIVDAPDAPLARALRWPPLVATGRVSYELYLFHVPVIYFILAEKPVPMGFVAAVVAIAATVALTLWSWFFVQRPAIRLKRRFKARGVSGEPDQIARASTAE